MTGPWVICIAREDAASVARLRLIPGLKAAEAGGVVWLQGSSMSDALESKLNALPATVRYELLGEGRLRQRGHRIPAGSLPALRWESLEEWLQVQLPVAALPGNEPPPVCPLLVRSTEEREPDLLLTSLERFKGFAAGAAEIRLKPLKCAAAPGDRLLILGQPLPPLPGRRFVLHGQVAVPAGFGWQPAVSADVLGRRFGVNAGMMVLWNEEGTITLLHAEQFLPATRGMVRATEEAITAQS